MRRSIATGSATTTTLGLATAGMLCLATGCLSGAYEQDFQARLQQYRREADGEPPVAHPAADAAAPAAPGEAE